MKHIKYFIQFLFISCLLILFKIVRLKFSRIIASKLFSTFGPFFRSKKIIEQNISFAFNESDKEFKKVIISNMWKSYGKILAEYVFTYPATWEIPNPIDPPCDPPHINRPKPPRLRQHN